MLGTFNKYKQMAESIGDKTVFLMLAEAFKAEHDSQVAIPMVSKDGHMDAHIVERDQRHF